MLFFIPPLRSCSALAPPSRCDRLATRPHHSSAWSERLRTLGATGPLPAVPLGPLCGLITHQGARPVTARAALPSQPGTTMPGWQRFVVRSTHPGGWVRPYHDDSTAPSLLSEVKHPGLVSTTVGDHVGIPGVVLFAPSRDSPSSPARLRNRVARACAPTSVRRYPCTCRPALRASAPILVRRYPCACRPALRTADRLPVMTPQPLPVHTCTETSHPQKKTPSFFTQHL